MPSREQEERSEPKPVPVFVTKPAAPLSEPFHIIGSAFDTYWYVQQGEVVYCIDQHAAHERLLYDALMAKQAAIVSQTLFLPEDVRLLPTERCFRLFSGRMRSALDPIWQSPSSTGF